MLQESAVFPYTHTNPIKSQQWGFLYLSENGHIICHQKNVVTCDPAELLQQLWAD